MMKSSEEIVNHYNYFHNTSFSRSLFYEINIMNFLTPVEFLIRKYLFYVKRYGGQRGQPP